VRHLVLFARRPEPGRAKTRLSPALPETLTAALYRGLVADALACIGGAGAESRSVAWDAPPGTSPPLPLPNGVEEVLQIGADLGERLAWTFAGALERAGDVALVVGADTPGLTPAGIAAAFRALTGHDVVLGPAEDGGYWCIGLARPAPGLFRDVPWSSERVLDTTRERAAREGLTLALTDALADLDTPADLAGLVGRLASDRMACGPALFAALQASGLVPAWRSRPGA
jgi:rSAM/selenodomain-associated transferase 1